MKSDFDFAISADPRDKPAAHKWISMKEKYDGSKECIICDHLHLCSGGVHWVGLGLPLSLHESEIMSAFHLQQHQYTEETLWQRMLKGNQVLLPDKGLDLQSDHLPSAQASQRATIATITILDVNGFPKC